jgi:hypothetical protein
MAENGPVKGSSDHDFEDPNGLPTDTNQDDTRRRALQRNTRALPRRSASAEEGGPSQKPLFSSLQFDHHLEMGWQEEVVVSNPLRALTDQRPDREVKLRNLVASGRRASVRPGDAGEKGHSHSRNPSSSLQVYDPHPERGGQDEVVVANPLRATLEERPDREAKLRSILTSDPSRSVRVVNPLLAMLEERPDRAAKLHAFLGENGTIGRVGSPPVGRPGGSRLRRRPSITRLDQGAHLQGRYDVVSPRNDVKPPKPASPAEPSVHYLAGDIASPYVPERRLRPKPSELSVFASPLALRKRAANKPANQSATYPPKQLALSPLEVRVPAGWMSCLQTCRCR